MSENESYKATGVLTKSPLGPLTGRERLWWLILLSLPVCTMLGFACYTGEIWEDFLITFRHTENLVHGNGLVFQPGERVHGFTSVLNTLVPAVPLLVSDSMTVALRFYQICSVSIAVFGLGVLLLAMRSRLRSSWLELSVLMLLIAFSIKIVAFTVNGQEAGWLIGFIALALAATLRLTETRQWLWLGFAAAGLLYTRPDSPVYMVVIAGIALAVHWPSRATVIKHLLRSMGVAALLYLPWLVIAWSYYGSPIPHTVIAKSNGHILVEDSLLLTIKGIWSNFIVTTADVFGPIYQPQNWPESLLLACTVAGLVAAFYWLAPIKDAFGKSCSVGLTFLLCYLAWTSAQRVAYPWYFVPASLLGSIVVARITAALLALRTPKTLALALAFGGIAIGASGACLVLSTRQLAIYQTEIEERTRKQVGLWLKANARSGDTVYTESLGYIGYYFGGKVTDYPGLVAPEVVSIRRRIGDNYGAIPVQLKPTWIVGRYAEVQMILSIEENKAAYEVVGKFDARPRLEQIGHFPGDGFLQFDAVFYVLHRKT